MTFEEKQSILTKNLHEFCKRQNLAKQQKELTVSELALLYSQSLSNPDHISKEIQRFSSEISATDQIIFLSEICRSSLSEKVKEMLFIGSTEPTSAGAHSKISYLKNRYNDLAFDYFSHSVPNAKPDFASSFTECCENVFDGRCEYCILPIMNSNDGRLMSFYSLLDRYELKICETVDIDAENSSSTMKIALIGRTCKLQTGRVQKNKKCVFEFSIIADNTDFFAFLFEGANKIQARLNCIDSIPIEYTPHLQKFFFSFSLPHANNLIFRAFIALNHQSYTSIGIYKETE